MSLSQHVTLAESLSTVRMADHLTGSGPQPSHSPEEDAKPRGPHTPSTKPVMGRARRRTNMDIGVQNPCLAGPTCPLSSWPPSWTMSTVFWLESLKPSLGQSQQ